MTVKRTRPARGETAVAGTLVLCAVVVAFWEVMAQRSRRPWEAFDLTASDFEDFAFESPGWSVVPRAVSASPIEPNIVMYVASRRSGAMTQDHVERSGNSAPAGVSLVLLRLVHGYNMPDCMRIKQYHVDLIADTHGAAELKQKASEFLAAGAGGAPSAQARGRLQFWRLTSSVGDRSIWVTSMLRAGDMLATDRDTCSMPFPRVGIPDDPDWALDGITIESLRRPVAGLRRALRAKWNKSRCDWRVFLGLKQPPWASEEMLTLVSSSSGLRVRPESESRAAVGVLEVHLAFYRSLVRWQRRRSQNDSQAEASSRSDPE